MPPFIGGKRLERDGRRTDARRAVELIQPTDTVVVGHAEPLELLDELCRQADRLRGLRLVVWPRTVDPPYLTAAALESFELVTLTHSIFRGSEQARVFADRIEYLPVHISQLCRRWPRFGWGEVVVLVHLSAPNPQGHLSMGACADYTWSFVRDQTRLVLGESNGCMPFTAGPNWFEPAAFDAIVDSERPVEFTERARTEVDEADRLIAKHTAALIPADATIQIGVGSAGGPIWSALTDRTDLAIHTGSMGEEAVATIDRWCADGAPDGRRYVAANIFARQEMLSNLPPSVEVWPNAYTHDVRVIEQIPTFVAINSCLQVDLMGQVFSESVRGRRLGTTGGQADFLRGATYSDGGLSIVVARASAARGKASGVARWASGQDPVTVSATDVDFVVTEHGVATLAGRTERERGRALSRIAAEPWRAELVAACAGPGDPAAVPSPAESF